MTALAAACAADAAMNGGDTWHTATIHFADEVEDAWNVVSTLASQLSLERGESMEDVALIGMAQIVDRATSCDSADGLFALREQAAMACRICAGTGLTAPDFEHAHLARLAFGLIADMCDRLSAEASEYDIADDDMAAPSA
ncbi:MAG: hypothetical protein KGN33_16890 [Paracoccaceae bacterium]|nr:hypothetical protein [Paracoccaceae bacterium]